MAHISLTPEEQSRFNLALYGKSAGQNPPVAFLLARNTPNPFNPATIITYYLPPGSPVYVRLDLYDLRGRSVYTLANELRMQGTHSVFWHGRDSEGRAVSAVSTCTGCGPESLNRLERWF